MNKEVASLILTNLRERAEASDAPVVLTSLEINALQVLFGETANLPVTGTANSNVDCQSTPLLGRSPSWTLQWQPGELPDSDFLLCLDFGTSFSKAYACRIDSSDDVPRLIDVSFGEIGDSSTRYFLPSELFINDEVVYFGVAARRKFETVEAEQDRLIDSPKQYMTLGTEVADLHQKPLRIEQDPSQSLSQRDALVLYLAHLNGMTERSLREQNLTSDVKRRYAHPAWDETTADANSTAMARMMAEAVVLTKCFPKEFEKNMPLAMARDITRQARAMEDEDLPFQLLVDPVREATAAGAGALMATRESRRQAYVILDIGAGTTDVAGCVCVNNPAEDYVKVAEVTGASKAIRRAGNNIDSILLNGILERSSLAKGTTEYGRASLALRKSIREYKETLFNDGTLFAELTTDEVVEIELATFLEMREVKKLFHDIKAIVTSAAFAVVGDDGSVFLVPTGGGSKLPIVDNLASSPIEQNGNGIRLRLRETMPEDLRNAYPQLVNIYPQLAVAIGGSHPELPKQLDSIAEGIRDPGPITLGPVYRS